MSGIEKTAAQLGRGNPAAASRSSGGFSLEQGKPGIEKTASQLGKGSQRSGTVEGQAANLGKNTPPAPAPQKTLSR